MKIISFAWTTDAIKARRKKSTRRDCGDTYASLFHKGELVQAWDRDPRVGGQRIGTIRLTADPYKESANQMSVFDWEDEGFAYMTEIGKGEAIKRIWEKLMNSPKQLWVVRFEIVDIYPAAGGERNEN